VSPRICSQAANVGGACGVGWMMENEMQDSTVQLLQTYGAWMRRLAAALLRGEADGQDVVQDTWETMLRRPPPHAGSFGGWLARVVGNRARNQARESARRRRREAAVAATQDSDAPSAEQIANVLEAQRTVGSLMASLDPARRQVIYLRFYEDLPLIEIARRLGQPAGTVRWRLKSALDELRAQLDERHAGDRARWRALLLPLSISTSSRGEGALAGGPGIVASAPAPSVRPAAPPWFWWVGAVGVTALAAGMLVLSWWSPGSRGPADPGAQARPVDQGRPLPRPGSVPPRAAAVVSDCPEVGQLSARLQARHQEMEARATVADIFFRSEPNPVAQQSFGQAYEAGLRTAGTCLHELECRGLVCRARLLVPDGVATPDCFPDGGQIWIRDRLDGPPPPSPGPTGDTPIFDPSTGQSFSRRDFYYRLARKDGAAGPPDAKTEPPPLLPDLLALRSPPEGRTPACRAEVRRVQADLLAAERKLAGLVGPAETFGAGAPRPDLVPEVKREMARILKLQDGAFPFRLECRGNSCAVWARGELDPPLTAYWDCNPPQDGNPQICTPDHNHGWYRLLEKGAARSSILLHLSPPSRHDGQERPGYLVVRGPDGGTSADTEPTFCRLSKAIKAAGVLERCQAESPPATGDLRLKLVVPGGDAPASSSRPRPALHHGGPLAGRPLGRCIVERLAEVLADFPVSDRDHSVLVQQTLRFPQPREILPADDRCPPP
jgi:RNA polymerase sigma factor (sigma-70 family)